MRHAAMATAVLVLLGFGLWARLAAPCELYGMSAVKDVPARCLMR